MSFAVQDLNLEEEDIIVAQSTNAADSRFDQITGTIEDIITGTRQVELFCNQILIAIFLPEPKFQQIQSDFLDKNYRHFDNTEENKLIYTTIHKEYINLVEKYLENELKKRISNFSMKEYMNDLLSRRDELDGEIFEILLTFEDFIEFKELMLSHKASKEGRGLDLSSCLCVQSINFGSNSSRAVGKAKTPLLDRTDVDHMDSDQD
ncbi:ADP-ribosylation factor 2-binding [Brachionus plicatilis]|uniref:ADP-ribosylation factor-like protein 2-binding protein n=1 Tax=Brachionus plicatilis TaxID=10195 RepID=A0A3M7SK15_BRAPC|nr:ADP-ribosylation factor 2-binding [Brachionus plicatilis]